MKKILLLLVLLVLFISCADSKDFIIDGEKVRVEPYGWFDTSEKHDSISYQINAGNIVWSVILSETIIVPILLTGTEFYEPVEKK